VGTGAGDVFASKKKMKNIMHKIFSILIALLTIFGTARAQTHLNLGAGYFGHFATHPGLVLEGELETMYSEKASLPLRVDLGFYSHPRYHDGIFLDVNYGFRRYFQSGLFLEQSIGIGLLQTRINSDAVYNVDDSGNATETGRFYAPDIMPSLTLGIGYQLSAQNKIWLRPKLFWQVPHKTSSNYHVAVQIGFTHQLSK
jgi:hypothetical protein